MGEEVEPDLCNLLLRKADEPAMVFGTRSQITEILDLARKNGDTWLNLKMPYPDQLGGYNICEVSIREEDVYMVVTIVPELRDRVLGLT